MAVGRQDKGTTMSTGYVHVLVAVDFSPFSNLATRRAAEIARISNAGLTMLHVVDYFPEDVPLDVVAPEDEDPADFLHRHAADQLAALARDPSTWGRRRTPSFTVPTATSLSCGRRRTDHGYRTLAGGRLVLRSRSMLIHERQFSGAGDLAPDADMESHRADREVGGKSYEAALGDYFPQHAAFTGR